jgi:hypothetical protein
MKIRSFTPGLPQSFCEDGDIGVMAHGLWRGILVGLVGLCALWGSESVAGQDAVADFDYDIFVADDTLSVWLDVTPVLTQEKLEDLLAGLDISIAVEMKLERPRPPWFSKTLAADKAVIVISRRLTEDRYRLSVADGRLRRCEFETQIELSDFLADSLVLRIAPAGLADSAGLIRLRLDIESKSHSSNILRDRSDGAAAAVDSAGSPDEGFFESLFSFFLDLTGFETTTYQIVSPDFRLSDLESF